MAFSTSTVTVGTSPVALNSANASATQIQIVNTGSSVIYLGTAGAGNQKFPLGGDTMGPIPLAANEQIFARTESGTVTVAVLVY